MKVAAITRFKNGPLWEACKAAGWSVAELSRRSKVQPTSLCAFMNLRVRLSANNLRKVQEAFAQVGVFLNLEGIWPEGFDGFSKSLVHEQVAEVPDLTLAQGEAAVYRELDATDARKTVQHLLSTLPEREANVIEGRFLDERTLDEIGDDLGVSREYVRQVEQTALRKLRHPVRMHFAKDEPSQEYKPKASLPGLTWKERAKLLREGVIEA